MVSNFGRVRRRRLAERAQHVRCYQHDAAFGHEKALLVRFGIVADFHIVRNAAILVQNATPDLRSAADRDAWQQYGIVDGAAVFDANVARQQRLRDIGARDDAAARDHRIDRHPAPTLFVEHEFRGRLLRLVGPDRPLMVVNVQLRIECDQFHVRFVERIHIADVAPIVLRACLDIFERVSEYTQFVERPWNDVSAKVVIAGLIGRVFGQQFLESVHGNHIDAHGCPRQIVMTDDGIGILRFLGEFHDSIGVVGGQNTEFVGPFDGYVDHPDRDVGFTLFVIRDHRTIVHLVNMIAGEDQHMGGAMRLDELDVLIHRVRGSAIPVRPDLLLSRNQLDEFTQLAAQVTPATLDVLDEGLRFVLREHGNLPNTGIDAIRQHEIDNPKLPAERRSGFAAVLGKRFETLAPTPRHDHRQCSARQSADIASGVITSSVSHTFLIVVELIEPAIVTQPATLGAESHQFLVCGEGAFARLGAMLPMKLCILSAEIMPYAKTGGLADVTGALLRELALLGHDVRAFMPLYGPVRRAHPELLPVPGLEDIAITIGATSTAFTVRTARFPGTEIVVYFVECPAMFDRAAFYTFDADEHRRFLLFTRAAIESCRRLGFIPDIYHCNDWHTAFLPLFLKTVYARVAGLAHVRSVLTIHNIGYQGIMSAAAVADLGLGAFEDRLDTGDRAAGVINPLKTGIKFADVVTTVSPTYAREICETPLGMGMQHTLRNRRNGVVGILNGVDYREWDPRVDPHLTDHFDADDLFGKMANKQQLLASTGLKLAPRQPLVSMVTRLAEQKGIDLLFDAMPALLGERDFGLLVLGSGDDRYVDFFRQLARVFPERVVFREGYDEALAHLIEAGSDMFLMPSRYEPCGLNQMYSLRYGTIPIVRKTGGLADSVQHYDPATGSGTGCVFNDYDAPAVRWAVGTALDWHADQTSWRKLMRNAMAQDLSWDRQVVKYEQVYRDALALPRSNSA